MRMCKSSCLYGSGTHFASQVCKAIQYTEKHQDVKTLIVSRVLLGDAHFPQVADKHMTRWFSKSKSLQKLVKLCANSRKVRANKFHRAVV